MTTQVSQLSGDFGTIAFGGYANAVSVHSNGMTADEAITADEGWTGFSNTMVGVASMQDSRRVHSRHSDLSLNTSSS